ncbi:PREDICTED: uncharacterized protein LOC105556702 [Vollenhovia emeryi]|uniref:uncharacterized protein LOC105556702 n=1 Tax=Vollenhovia emeryi TaxID=411798 RepID=UPI0005F56633|nr:PREDICTED: uncharacterized protein LOC105556702 [Vollenhovia emeryi]
MHSTSKGIVQITIRSIRDGFQKNLTCLTLPIIADLIPSEIFPRDSIGIPPNIKLADPEFHLPRPVDLLIGSGATLSLFSVGQINLSCHKQDLYLQKTRLGWIIAGGVSSRIPAKTASSYLIDLETQITKFWTIEEVAVDRAKSEEDIKCEAHFVKNVSRNHDGRYVVRLPFRDPNVYIGESRSVALKRLSALMHKLDRNPSLKTEYTRTIEEYERLGHMSLVNSPGDDGFYMPHHAVIKESSNTTKVRIVFDASAKSTSGVSLNDILLIGPTIQDKLFSHLIRFRTYNYVITADIEKMYRQVLLHEDDRRFQQILWREDGKVKTYQLNTLTFGVSSSPFLAIRTLQKLAEDEGRAYPNAAKVLKDDLYVDDLLTGGESIHQVRDLRDEIISLLARGGFHIRQWASNDARVVDDLPNHVLHANYILTDDRSLKTLGISWNTINDKIRYSTNPIKISETITKRKILSEIAKIYDPIGLLGPVVLYAKRLIQEVWKSKVQWDESIPQSTYTEWTEFVRQLEALNQVTFDRKITVEKHHNIQLHGFCDASNTGYGACLYLRSVGDNKKVISRLVCAKSRVAPLKTVTIPRLELCGALLLARLYSETVRTLNFSLNRTIFWCDSTIVLHWLKMPPYLLKTYVANRVAEIQENTNSIEWRHIRSEDNPADAISRGQLPHSFIQNELWRAGPSWLTKTEDSWPNEIPQTTEVLEVKGNTCLTTMFNDTSILERYSSYTKLCKIVAYCLRLRRSNKYSGSLSAKEIREAEVRVLKIYQGVQFAVELEKLKNKRPINKGKIANLDPFLDEDGLIRVGGRLRSSNLTFAQKHPAKILVT